MTIAFAGLFALQFIETMPLDYFILLALLTLALVLGGIGLGLKTGSPALLWLGYAGLLDRGAGDLLQDRRHAARLVAVLPFGRRLVILLAVVAYRLHARVQPGMEAAP